MEPSWATMGGFTAQTQWGRNAATMNSQWYHDGATVDHDGVGPATMGARHNDNDVAVRPRWCHDGATMTTRRQRRHDGARGVATLDVAAAVAATLAEDVEGCRRKQGGAERALLPEAGLARSLPPLFPFLHTEVPRWLLVGGACLPWRIDATRDGRAAFR